jgi:hypothetical protein
MNRSSPAWTWTVLASGEPDGAIEAGADASGEALASADGDASVDGASTDGAVVAVGVAVAVLVLEHAARTVPARATVAPRRNRVDRVIVTSEVRSRRVPRLTAGTAEPAGVRARDAT